MGHPESAQGRSLNRTEDVLHDLPYLSGNLLRAGLTGRHRAATLADMGGCRMGLGLRDVSRAPRWIRTHTTTSIWRDLEHLRQERSRR